MDWRLTPKHYRKRFELVEKNGFSMKIGFEPETHHRAEKVDDLTSDSWKSEFPNADIRHGNNLSPTKWEKNSLEIRNLLKVGREAILTIYRVGGIWENGKDFPDFELSDVV